jgi:K+-transporting ATPase ATPase C chain
MTLVLTIMTGIVFPVMMAGLAHVLFPYQAEGSLISRDGRVVGSELIGQNFSAPGYFHGRPSAAGDKGYDATSSSGSNLGPTNKSLIDTVSLRLKDLLEKNPDIKTAQVPTDIVTASGSGLDPEISPAGAEIQIPRVAKARGLSEDSLRALVNPGSTSSFSIWRWTTCARSATPAWRITNAAAKPSCRANSRTSGDLNLCIM